VSTGHGGKRVREGTMDRDDVVVEDEPVAIDARSLALLEDLVAATERIADVLERLIQSAMPTVPRPRVHAPARPPEELQREEWPS
jgi:hypothetical protein